jgi:hypothetical protein
LIGLVSFDGHLLLELGRLEHVPQARNVGELLPFLGTFHEDLREAVDFAIFKTSSQFPEDEGALSLVGVHDVEALPA